MLKRLLAAGLFGFIWIGSAWAEQDVAGASDYPTLNRFPFSWIVEYHSEPVPEYALALGAMKKIDGVVRPEESERLQGRLSRITYRIPDGYSADEVFAHFKAQLEAHGAATLFVCSSRQCGSSNQWANNQFRVAELYGVDRSQSYLAAKSGSSHYALYTVKRGNRRVYAHLDIIESTVVQAESLDSQLQQAGFSWLPIRYAGGMPVNLDEAVQPLLEYLRQNPQRRIMLAGYLESSADKSLLELMTESKNHAALLASALLEAGIEPERVEVAGVGPLLPVLDVVSSPAVWVQLR